MTGRDKDAAILCNCQGINANMTRGIGATAQTEVTKFSLTFFHIRIFSSLETLLEGVEKLCISSLIFIFSLGIYSFIHPF